MLSSALILFLLAAEPSSGAASGSGFGAPGFGIEVGGSVAFAASSGSNAGPSGAAPLWWEVALRLRIGQFFSVGGSYESLSRETGPGDDQLLYTRKQLAADVQWRFWGIDGRVRPWIGAGMAWGNIHSDFGYGSSPSSEVHVWEFLRLGAGVDFIPLRWMAIGPWIRVGFANTPSTDVPGDSSLRAFVFGLRLLVAFP